MLAKLPTLGVSFTVAINLLAIYQRGLFRTLRTSRSFYTDVMFSILIYLRGMYQAQPQWKECYENAMLTTVQWRIGMFQILQILQRL